MNEEADISKLLRLKRYERPPEGYFEDFLFEFQRRQRIELLRRPTREIVWERLLSFAPTFRVPRVAYAGILALAALASTVIVLRQPEPRAAILADQPLLSLTPSKSVTIGDTLPVSARADGPSHYVLESRPVSNEQPLSF